MPKLRKKTRNRSSRQRSDAQKFKKIINMLVIASIALGISGAVFAIYHYARIQTVTCQITNQQGLQTRCGPQVMAKIEAVKNSPIIFYNHHKVTQDALADEPLIITTIEKQFPQTLWISLRLENIAYQVKQGEQLFAITVSGKQFSLPEAETENQTIFLENSQNSELLNYHDQLQQVLRYSQHNELPITSLSWNNPEQISVQMSHTTIQPVIRIAHWQRDLMVSEKILAAPEFADYLDQDYYLDSRFTLPVLKETL
ncbi:MAG: hypothetical protein WDZ94_03455 [Patescibacteria group bacterium]